nr:3-keto-5-aminohexanoate cleavage protein [Kordiimonas marina]
MVAPNGARRTKADHTALPMGPAELAACAREVLDAGASIFHLHVRDDNGAHTLDTGRYREAINAIRGEVGSGLILQVTSEAVGQYGPAAQMAMVRDLRPEAVSVALRELVPGIDATDAQRAFFDWMREAGIFYQVILYDAVDLARFDDLLDEGFFGDLTPFVLFVAGRYGQEAAEPGNNFEYFRGRAGALSFPWAVCAFGAQEYDAVLFAARQGGHVRVGFENNLWRPDGEPVSNNAELVHEARRQVELTGRTVATADDVRAIFNFA